MRAFRSICLAVTLLLLLRAAAAQDDVEVPLTVERRVSHPDGTVQVRFDNGLHLVCRENTTAPVVSVRVFVKVGSIYEGEMLGTGVSHYFEHVISGGATRIRTEAENRDLLRRIGNVSNAYTSRDVTVYFINTAAEHFGTAADLLGSYMAHNIISPDEFERERGVIIQEIRKNRDNPSRLAHQMLSEAMFPDHPAGKPVIGYLPLFKEVTREQVQDFYQRFYVSNNTVVAVVGAVPAEEQIRTVARTFSDLKRGTPNHPQMPPVPRQLSPRWAETKSAKVTQTRMLVGHHTVPLDHPDLYALDVAADILGAGRTSRLYKALRQTGLVHSVYSYSHTPTYNAGTFVVGAVLEDPKRHEVLATIVEEINRLKAELVSDEELERAIKNKVTSEVFRTETMADQAADIGYNFVHTQDPTFTEHYLAGIRKVTPEEVRRVAREYLRDDGRTVALLRPDVKETPAQMTPHADAREAASEQDEEIGFEAIERITLDNGVRVLYGHDPHVGSVLIQTTFLGGVRSESPQTAGACQLMSTLLLRGTESRTAEQLHRDVEDMGAQIYATSGNNSWYAGLKLLPEDLDSGMAILGEVVFQPQFDPSAFERERALQMQRLAALDDSWQAEASRHFRSVYFQGHPYARHTLGTVESLKGLTRQSLAAYHRRLLNPEACVVAVFGDVGRDEAVKAVKAHFDGTAQYAPAAERWTRTEREFAPPAPTVAAKANEKTQAVLTWGFSGEEYAGEDIPAITVLDAVLSGYGYPSGRLHHALRGEADLVYLIHAWNWSGLDAAAFQILTQTSPENIPEVMDRVRKAVQSVRTETVSEEELRLAKNSIVIGDAIANEPPRSRALQATYDELYGAGHEHHADFAERIHAVTAEDVRRVAQTYLDDHVLCVTGPQEAVATAKAEAAVPRNEAQ
jgi:zinc protease